MALLDNNGDDIIFMLNNLYQYNIIIGDKYRARAYNLAINNFKFYLPQLKLIKNKDNLFKQIEKIPGIGKGSISQKIKDIINGKSINTVLTKEIINTVSTFEQLLKIYGFGIKKVKELIKMGIKNISQLKKASNTGKIKLNNIQKIGLKYHTQINTPIEHSEMIKIDKLIQKLINGKFIFKIVGSYRRKTPRSNDIDIIVGINTDNKNIAIEKANNFINILKDENILIETLKDKSLSFNQIINKQNNKNINKQNNKGINKQNNKNINKQNNKGINKQTNKGINKQNNKGINKQTNKGINKQTNKNKFTVLSCEYILRTKYSKIAHKVDIKFYSSSTYYSAILYFTGSKTFNINMRQIAKKKGYLLNEYGLFKISKGSINLIPEKIKSEKNIFDILGIPYISPSNRV